ncbi:MAG: HAMP domain-containing histidine kinase [Blastocatellia bacterium]|nr:HAMP domain-containing histidine kinase [Blastocatellia bacterium]
MHLTAIFRDPTIMIPAAFRQEFEREAWFGNYATGRAVNPFMGMTNLLLIVVVNWLNVFNLHYEPSWLTFCVHLIFLLGALGFGWFVRTRDISSAGEMTPAHRRWMYVLIGFFVIGVNVVFSVQVQQQANPLPFAVLVFGLAACFTLPGWWRHLYWVNLLYFLVVVSRFHPEPAHRKEAYFFGLLLTASGWVWAQVLLRSRVANFLNRKEIEAQAAVIAAKNRDLVQLNEELRVANQLKSDLLEIAAHDLRGPLATIKGYTGLLKTAPDHPDWVLDSQDLLNEIEQASQNMLALITKLLDTALIEQYELVLHKKPVPMQTLFSALGEQLLPLALSKGQKLVWEVEPSLQVEADELRLREILENLIGNAIKYAPLDTTIQVKARLEKQAVLVSVQDEGPGFTPEDCDHVFEKFRRLSARPTAGESSVGLGLWIVKQLVLAHQGRIWLETAVGQGSTFWVSLPATGSGVRDATVPATEWQPGD